MRDLATLFVHLIWTVFRLLSPGGVRSVVSESVLLRHQLLILNRSRERAPNLRPTDRLIAGLCTLLIRPTRLLPTAVVLKPSTLMGFHRALVKRKYRRLFTPRRHGTPGPKGPPPELIAAVLEMKRRNPRFGYQRIAEQLALAFGIEIDKDTVRRVLAKHYRPDPSGPSWLTFLAHSKDSLWSVDFFRCESLILRTHWVMVVMDQFTRRIVGFAVHPGVLDGLAVCRMFNHVLGRSESVPQSLSSDHDPLFLFHRWRANLRILQIREIKSVPYVPLSHPFVERLIGTIRRELLDQAPYWTSTDLERKLSDFMRYYNRERTHRALGGNPPVPSARAVADIRSVMWQSHCRGLYQLPFAA
jgi:transposase InsO family protein